MTISSAAAIDRRGAVSVGIGSVLFAASGYVVLLLAARILSPANNAAFLAFWSFLFFWFGILSGLSLEATRAVNESTRRPIRPHGARVLTVALGLGLALAVIIATTTPLWAQAVFGRGRAELALVVAFGVLLWSGHSAVVGILAGHRRWTRQALVIGGDGVLRVLVVVLVALTTASVAGFAAAAAFGTVAWIVLGTSIRSIREIIGTRVHETPAQFALKSASAMTAAAASAAIVVGFPVLLRLTSSDDDYLAAAPLILSVTLTRAPLLVPLNAYQSVVITHFLTRRDRVVRSLAPIGGIVLLVACVGAGLAWLIGPWLLMILINPDYHVSGIVLASLTLAAGLLALLSLTGALDLALGRHFFYAGGWIVATAGCVLVLLFPIPIEARAVLSLVVGPLVGIVVHGVGLMTQASRRDVVGGRR